MDIAIIGIVIVGALALMYFTRKAETKVTPTPMVQPYPEAIEDWRREMWEGMRLKNWTDWTEEEWQSLRLTYGDPGFQEAYINLHGQAAWDELMLKRQQYEASQAKHEAAEAEMDAFLEDVQKAGYALEDIQAGIPQSYFTDLYGPAWAWVSSAPGRVEAMREYFLEHHPNLPLPKELVPAPTPKPVIEVPAPTLPTKPVTPEYKVTFTDGSTGYFTAETISHLQDMQEYGIGTIKSVQW